MTTTPNPDDPRCEGCNKPLPIPPSGNWPRYHTTVCRRRALTRRAAAGDAEALEMLNRLPPRHTRRDDEPLAIVSCAGHPDCPLCTPDAPGPVGIPMVRDNRLGQQILAEMVAHDRQQERKEK